MKTAPRVKVSISLSEDLLRRIDEQVARTKGGSRSATIEMLLQRAYRKAAADKLVADTIAYYESLTEQERDEDRQWAQFSADAMVGLGSD